MAEPRTPEISEGMPSKTDQWQKSEEIMKKVSDSCQYGAKASATLASEGCPTMRGISRTSSRLPFSAIELDDQPSKDMTDVGQVHLQRVLLFVYSFGSCEKRIRRTE